MIPGVWSVILYSRKHVLREYNFSIQQVAKLFFTSCLWVRLWSLEFGASYSRKHVIHKYYVSIQKVAKLLFTSCLCAVDYDPWRVERGGWPALPAHPRAGGQDLPLHLCCQPGGQDGQAYCQVSPFFLHFLADGPSFQGCGVAQLGCSSARVRRSSGRPRRSSARVRHSSVRIRRSSVRVRRSSVRVRRRSVRVLRSS